jgi:hypothetical protein
MDLEKYRIAASDSFLDFEFVSEGPKGKIRKVVRYSPQNANGITYFHLGFGDLNPDTGMIDDLAITNNADRDKVLATVAASVLKFTEHFPDALVYATGSTSARTRLYQIGISANLQSIEPILDVFGFVSETGWQPFQKGIHYLAFLVKRK